MKPRVLWGLYHGFFNPARHPLKPLTFGSSLKDEPIAWRRGRLTFMVHNNVDDPVTIRRLAPVDNALVLITTRRTDWDGDVDELPVDVFDRGTAVEFLMASVSAEHSVKWRRPPSLTPSWRGTGGSLLANSMDRQRGVSPADRELTGTSSN